MTRWSSCWLPLGPSVAVVADAMLGSSLAPMVASASSDPTWTGNTLQVNTGGGFIPAHRQAVPVLVYHSRGGTFATLRPPHLTVGYGATAARAVCP